MSAGPAAGAPPREPGPFVRATARRRVRRRRIAAAATLLAVAAVFAVLLWPGADDPFSGVYWDPDSGRRVEITRKDGRYRLLYGVAKVGYEAERRGDELQVRDPFSGYVVVRANADGLMLVSGRRETRLERLTEGQ